MEEKKSYIADLERQRPTIFLMGLVVALALCLAALELATHPDTSDADMELLEEFAQDLQQLNAPEQNDMVTVAEPAHEEPAVAETVREVEKAEPIEDQQQEEQVAASLPQPPVAEVPPLEVDPLAPPPLPPVILDVNDDPVNLRVKQDAPSPEGGWSQFMKWLHQNLKYPPTAKTQKIQGTVLVTFIVNADGTVSNLKVAQTAEASLEREAMRVLRSMPKWQPGIVDGKPVRMMVGVPVVFKL